MLQSSGLLSSGPWLIVAWKLAYHMGTTSLFFFSFQVKPVVDGATHSMMSFSGQLLCTGPLCALGLELG